MRHCIVSLVSMLAVFLVTLAPAGATHTPEDAVALVRRAAEYLHTHDRATALAAFSDPNGPFRDGDLYLYVLDTELPVVTVVAHGSMRSLIGVAETDLVDADGNDVTGTSVALANSQGEGWLNYDWPNPDTKKIAPKSTFLLKVGALIICAGVYK